MAKKKAGGLLGALVRVGLVEVDDKEAPAEADRPAAGEPEPVPAPSLAAAAAGTAAAPAAAAVSAPPTAVDIAEQQPLEQIYAAAGVPAANYSAERMLKVLNGLRAMDINTRRAAVLAIDAADDSWKIEDVLLDADRKIKALQGRKQQLAEQATAADAAAREEISARDRKQQEAVAAIRQQMADLQALMEREVAAATHDKKDAEARAVGARDAAQRESARLDAEINRLLEIPNTFPAAGPLQG